MKTKILIASLLINALFIAAFVYSYNRAAGQIKKSVDSIRAQMDADRASSNLKYDRLANIEIGLKKVFPLALEDYQYSAYAAMLYEAEIISGISWQTLAALAYFEDRFRTWRASDSGALGLMQIKPETAKEQFSKLYIKKHYLKFEDFSLFEPALNAILSALYLKENYDLTGGNMKTALILYNAGRIKRPQISKDFADSVLSWAEKL